jgi:hypothetical protein
MGPDGMFGPLEGDCCPWIPPAFRKTSKHSRLHIVARRLAQGLHPLGHARLAGNGQTCGTCSHRRLNDLRAGRYWKCNQVPMTGGPASDVRLKYPACMLWAPGVSTDDYSLMTGGRR